MSLTVTKDVHTERVKMIKSYTFVVCPIKSCHVENHENWSMRLTYCVCNCETELQTTDDVKMLVFFTKTNWFFTKTTKTWKLASFPRSDQNVDHRKWNYVILVCLCSYVIGI